MENGVLLTGGNGFLGTIIQQQFSQVVTLGISKNNVVCDLSKEIPQFIQYFETVIHAAGKAHFLPKTKRDEQSFFDVNVRGTENLLKGLDKLPSLPKSFVFISSVAVYGAESGNYISESHPLNATDAYGLSKLRAECLVQQWCDQNKIICTILRLPLVVAENPPGNLRRMINGVKRGYYFNIAGGKVKRSMVLALDVATFIFKASKVGGVFNLTDGYHPTFAELSALIAKQSKKKNVLNISYRLAKILAHFGDINHWFPINSKMLRKLTSNLIFDDKKARRLLGWNPKNVLDNFKIE